jgi:hypothetical protein
MSGSAEASVSFSRWTSERTAVRGVDRVSLTFERPSESGSLFRKASPTRCSARRASRCSSGPARRADARETLAQLLEKQFSALDHALLEPGRAVAVGGVWRRSPATPSAGLGIRVPSSGDASATLRREPAEDGPSGLVIDYRIPSRSSSSCGCPRTREASRSRPVSKKDPPRLRTANGTDLRRIEPVADHSGVSAGAGQPCRGTSNSVIVESPRPGSGRSPGSGATPEPFRRAPGCARHPS